MHSAVISIADIASLRAFNRIYTSRLGLLNAKLDGSPFPLTEARVLYELAHRERPTAAEIGRALSLDKAQLSRILKQFAHDGLIESVTSPAHGKHRLLALTDAGLAAFAALDLRTQEAVASMLAELSEPGRRRLLIAAGIMRVELAATPPLVSSFVLRNLRVGDVGWVTHRQAVLYGEEYGWDTSYEALVAEILAGFVARFDPARERSWIAELDGAIMGSIFLMSSSDPNIGKLRLLYVEPAARGLGIGRALVDACVAQAKSSGYARLELWTNSVLVSARRIYEAVGFQLIDESPHRSFGHDLVGQTWCLQLL